MPTTITRQVKFGYESKLFLSANAGTQTAFADSQCVGSVKDLTETHTPEMIDISDRDGGANGSEAPGKETITLEFNMNARKDKWGYCLLRKAERDRTPLAFLTVNSDNDVWLVGDAYVSSMKQNEPLKDAVTVDVTLTITTELRSPAMTEPTLTTGTETTGTWGTTSTSGSNSTGGN